MDRKLTRIIVALAGLGIAGFFFAQTTPTSTPTPTPNPQADLYAIPKTTAVGAPNYSLTPTEIVGGAVTGTPGTPVPRITARAARGRLTPRTRTPGSTPTPGSPLTPGASLTPGAFPTPGPIPPPGPTALPR